MNEQIIVNINNLTEGEREQFKKLLEKANKENRVWKPEDREKYYYIDGYSCATEDSWEGLEVDIDRFDIGNAFKTREEAEIALERARVKAELQKYALEHNDPEKEAWNNDNGHYKIAFDHRVNDFFMTRGYYMEEESVTYFTSPEIAREAITTIGRERILKYIFGVDCEEETND